MRQFRLSLVLCALLWIVRPAWADPHPGTSPLKLEGDITSQLVDGVDRFLLRQLADSIDKRAAHWKRNLSSPQAYVKSVAANRARLAEITGVVDKRDAAEDIEVVEVAQGEIPRLIANGEINHALVVLALSLAGVA